MGEHTTSTSSTWLEPDGTYRTELFSTPVNYKRADGSWDRIDNRLTASDAAGVAAENAANDFTVRFPEDASERPVRFANGKGWLSFAMRDLDGTPTVKGSTATYPGVGDASSVVFDTHGNGLKESIVLDAPPAEGEGRVEFVYDLSASAGLRPVLKSTGAVHFLNEQGEVVFRILEPFMHDSVEPDAGVSTDAEYTLVPSGEGWELQLSVDRAWLRSPDRVYPVTIDPTITDQPPAQDCYISRLNPDANYCAFPVMRVGIADNDFRRGLVKFDLDDVPTTGTITGASLHLYLDATQTTTGTGTEYVVRQVSGSQPWTNAATYRKRDAVNNWSTFGGSMVATEDDGLVITGLVSGYKALPAMPQVAAWLSGSPNNGLFVKQRVESTTNLLTFVSANTSDSSKWPKLVVHWTDQAPPAVSQAGERKYFTFTEEKLTDRMSAKVNTGNGNLLVSASDARVAGVAGLDLNFTRTYNSATAGSVGGDKAKLGPGWSHNLGGSVRLEFPNGDGSRVHFFGPSGYRVAFDKTVGGSYIRLAPGMDGNMRHNSADNTLRVDLHSKGVYVFRPFATGDPASGQLKEIRDKNGNKLTFAYNTDGTLASATDTRGRTAVFSYRTGDGMLGSVDVRNSAGTSLFTYAYDYVIVPAPTGDGLARLSSSRIDAVNTDALTTTTNLDDVDALTTYTYTPYNNGPSTQRLTEIKDARENTLPAPGGGTTTIQYTTAGKVSSVSRLTDDPELPNSTSTYTYPGTLPSACNSQGTHAVVVDGERTDVTPTDTTTYCADTHDRIVRTVDAKGHVRKATWTSNSNVETFDMSGLSSGGSSFSFGYENDNPETAQTPDGAMARAEYGDTAANAHFPTGMRDFDTGGDKSKPATWSYDYDDDGNLIEASAPVTSGKDIRYRYCWTGTGQLQRVDPQDANGLSSFENPDEDLGAGCGTANQGNDTLYSYDGLDQLTTIDPPGSHRTQEYTYDALSRVKTVIDGRGVKVTYSYDAMDRVVKQVFDPSNATGVTGSSTITVTWAYDRAGNRTTLNDPTATTSFDYDELNRVVRQSQQLPSPVKVYRYDPADNLLEVAISDEPEATKYTYDSVNLVTSVDDQRLGVNKVTFSYDKKDKRTKTVFPMPGGNDVIQRARYSDGGRIECIYSYRKNTPPVNDTLEDPACPAATAAGLVSFHKYDYIKTLPGGLSIETNTRYKIIEKGAVTTTNTYDPISRLTSAVAKAGNTTTTLRSFTYEYDRHSNLTKDVTTGTTLGLVTGTTHLFYNDAEELCWTAPTAPIPTGSCGSTPSGGTGYTHDGAGALANASNGLALLYNAIGQTSSIDPAGSVGPIPMAYTGVTQDRRTKKDNLNMSYAFAGLSSQSTNSGVPHAEWFVRDPGGKLISQIDRNTQEPDRYYLVDAQDSIIATIDTGGTVRRYLYEPYGEQIRTWVDPNPTNNTSGGSTPPDGSHNTPTTQDDAADVNPWRFASGYYDTETRMLKFGTRYYMPSLSRWSQVDPEPGKPQQPMTLNPYLYAGDNPVNLTDPTGRYWGEDFVDAATDEISSWRAPWRSECDSDDATRALGAMGFAAAWSEGAIFYLGGTAAVGGHRALIGLGTVVGVTAGFAYAYCGLG